MGFSGGNRIHDAHGVARGAQNIALRLHFHRGVDVADDHVIGMALTIRAHLLRGAAIDQAASGIQIGQHHGPRGVQDFRGFGHEHHAAKRDNVAFKVARSAGQLQAVADRIRELLNFGILVVMRQNDGAALLLQLQYFVDDGLRGQHTGELRCPTT